MTRRAAVTTADLRGRTPVRCLREPFGMLAAGPGAGMVPSLAVALANPLRRAVRGRTLQFPAFTAAPLLLVAAHLGFPFLTPQEPSAGSSSLSISFRHAASVPSASR